MPSRRFLSIAIASVLALSACAGEPDGNTAEPAPSEGPPVTASDPAPSDPAPSEGPPVTASEDGSSPVLTATGDDDYPVMHFAAHGEGSPNTYGPSCAVGIETSTSSLFRVTAPDGWTAKGGSGGSGSTSQGFDVDGVRTTIYFASHTSELGQYPDLELGAQVGSVELPNVTAELVEVNDYQSGAGDLSGYGISEVPWLTNMPGGTEQTMTIFVTSSDPAVPTLEDATALLSTVRVERCAGISQAIISYSSSHKLAVPHVENDPLGKPFPGGDQPKFVTNPLDAWTVEQLAYLLPLPAPADHCAAQKLQDPSVRATLPPTLTMLMAALAPTNDADKAALLELSESC